MGKEPNVPTPEDQLVQDHLKNSGAIPNHIAIIMDGNGRWAKKRGLPRVAGHHEGVSSVRDIVEVCGQLGVGYLTLYAFSTENWKRPKDEVSTLMRLLLRSLRDETDRLHENNVRLKTIGNTETLPRDVQDELMTSIERTRNNTGLTLVLALSYSGRWDIINGIKSILHDVKNGKVGEEEVTENLLSSYLTTKEFPDPDLMIRTSGESRISNFLLWELAYTEIHIAECYWPDFRRAQLYEAIRDFQKRERRFGLVSEQLCQSKTSIAKAERGIKSVTRV